MKVYRDCLNGVPPFDGFPDASGNIIPAYFTIYDVSGNVILSSSFNPLSFITVPPTNNSPCAPTTAGNACVEEALYDATVNLPPKVGGYYIVYQRCCRNATILNLINPGAVGATYWEHIPGPEVVLVNNSPRFTNRPPIYICNGIPIAFDHIASDPDGDSLVYSLCTPFDGLDACCPTLNSPVSGSTYCTSPPASCPTVNSPPPYVSVPFNAPYNSSYPMASSPAISINPITGFLNGVPTINGQWVVGVCVEEYRNGQLIGTHHRDFQFNVIPCPFVVVAAIQGETTTNNGAGTGYCNGFTIAYQDSSYGNVTSYFWDFGDTTTLADTSHLQNPSYTFTNVGTYTVTIIANPGSLCSDTAYKVFHVFPLLSPDYIAPNSQCLSGNSFNFMGSGTFQPSGTFNWSFGANATPQTANTSSVSNVTYNASGTYPVVFTVAENGCTAIVTKTIEVWQNPQAVIGNFNTSGCDPVTVTFQNLSTASTSMSYLWSFSDGTTSTAQNPTHVFSPAGVYSVSLSVSTNQNCIDTSKVTAINTITVTATPVANFNYLSATGLCFNNNNFTFNSTTNFLGPFGVLGWNFGTNATPQTSSLNSVPNVSFNAVGIYPVTLIASENGCSDTITKSIELYQNPIAAISTVTALGCDPLKVTFNDLSTAASNIKYLWTFSNGETSTDQNPTHVFSPAGIYTYTLMITTNSKCIDTSIVSSVSSITVNPSPVASFTANPIETTIFDPDIYFYNTAGDPSIVTWNYNFDDGSNSNEVNPMHTYATWGDYNVSQTITNTFGCPNTAVILIKILPEFRFWIPNAFTPGNKDNLNDVFKPIVIGVEDYTFMIFDRWGELIFKTKDTEAGWNGIYKGKASPNDVFVWKCEFKNIVSNEYESHVGHVTIVR